MTHSAPASADSIVLFDGVCNFCNHSVHFIIDRDLRRRYKFAALQSDIGRQLLAENHLDPATINSVVLLENGRCFTKSTAALRIAGNLRFPWRLCAALRIIPSFVRDPIYNLIAKNRYRLFGKSDACRIPTPALRERFLDPASTSN